MVRTLVAIALSIASFTFGFCEDRVARMFPTAECVVDKVGSAYVVTLGEQIEGIYSTVAVQFVNDTGEKWKGLLGKSSCGCLASKSIDGRTVHPKSTLVVELTITPSTRQGFQQNFLLNGVIGDNNKVELLAAVSVRAAVKPPVSMSKTGFSVEDLESKPSKSMVRSGVPGRTEIVWENVSLQSDDLEMKFEHRESMTYGEAIFRRKAGIVREEGAEKLRDLYGILLVPFRLVGKEEVYVFQSPIQFFVTKALKVAPSAINLRRQEGAEDVEVRLVITDRRGLTGSGEDFVYQLVRKDADGTAVVLDPSIRGAKIVKTSGGETDRKLIIVQLSLSLAMLEGTSKSSHVLRVSEGLDPSVLGKEKINSCEVELILDRD